MKCPVKTQKGQIKCDYEFDSNHYTDIQPHLETHSTYDLARSMTRLMYKLRWSNEMASEIIESCGTLVQKDGEY